MTDVPLFDPTPYVVDVKRKKRKKRGTIARRAITVGPGWGLLARLSDAPGPVAHRWQDGKPTRMGAYTTLCGLSGRRIEVDAGAIVVACRECEGQP